MLQGKNRKNTQRYFKTYLKNKALQRIIIGITIVLIAFAIIENGTVPAKYKLTLGESSRYDITAPRDIENKLKTRQLGEAAAEAVPPVMTRLDNIPIDVIGNVDEFLTTIENARKNVEKSLQAQEITKKNKKYLQILELEQALSSNKLEEDIKIFNVPLSEEQVKYLVAKTTDEELTLFEKVTKDMVSTIMKEEINENNLALQIVEAQSSYQKSEISQDLMIIGGLLVKAVLKPNSTVDVKLTNEKKQEALKTATENKQIIPEGSRILSIGDVVTGDKLEVLKELNLLETGKFDYVFAMGILAVVLLLAALLILYMNFFCKKILHDRQFIILLGVIILLTLIIARIIYPISPLLITIFIAPMLISILVDLRLAIVVNFILSISISLIIKGDMTFFYVSLIGGTFSAFIVSKANQRNRLSALGLIIAGINTLIITCLGILNKSTLNQIGIDCGIIAVNGVLSAIFTIGILPIFESTFKIITPLKLLELSNPNQPLIKRLLLEAPGTYHHSLMVGNLAEMATEAIEGNALLARVGAYYHDIGKLKRPNFFKENQMSENPHDRMTPNLSTLVITSHTNDGADMADSYKIPNVIKDIIYQHHGTTLAAYFYYKAKKSDKGEKVKQEDFRYQGPRPSTKEAAVVMLADSVEAAVRSMVDKTEGKIEGLIRRIIKDKLEDGQLNLCELTMKDMENIARAFLRVFGGYFHEREEYPDMKIRKLSSEGYRDDNSQGYIEMPKRKAEENSVDYESF